MMTTIDRDAPGYPGDAYGLSDEEAKELRWPAAPLKEILWPWGAVTFAFGAAFMLLIWPHINAYLSPVLPETEWAYDSTGIRELQDSGLDGSGVHVCMVDTGLDSMHPDLANISLVGFRDFYEGQHGIIRDVGEEWHGTMMAGLLVADGKFRGAAPGVDLSIALALGPSGTSGQEDFVAQAVRWCRITQEVDIISLSLGSDPGRGMAVQSETARAVEEALEAGIFVVAAAGNRESGDQISDVSVPANIEGVIAVGTITRNGATWSQSATGSAVDPYTQDNRSYPNQKPEVIAPGVLLLSTSGSSSEPPYSYSTGTSDSTVLVTGALALILQLHGEDLRGDDGIIGAQEMALVKRSLASSCDKSAIDGAPHDSQGGYGSLDAAQWAADVGFELNTD
ncbi:MAG: S8 family serine peptidase [Candidatus Thalassarchaeum sp.]|uniref:Serine protease (Isp) n=1 Tax=uncultured marine group II/III euryarchaeote KM3_36_F10 TaxID=1456440 RepID=A0A075H4D7_9EURY|nr:serine protease (isp) [uncultured marine group II/III euryarchaeote KM3_36_F10]